ncbi:MAG: heavy metal-associated domain-containing protein [Patescibacteria group bacterium]|nr:heavy metal-associated domain-containing protein [Patescibacteria group bacterium]
MTTIVQINGTHCESCKALIEDVCREVPGVKSCTVDFRTGKTEVRHDEQLDWQIFKEAIESLGQYRVTIPSV